MRQTSRTNIVMCMGAALLISTGALAQPGPNGSGWGPGMMMGPGMMGSGGFGFLCNPRMAGFAEWRISQIEASVKPNEAQKALLNDLKTASTKAAAGIRSCPTGSVSALPLRASCCTVRVS